MKELLEEAISQLKSKKLNIDYVKQLSSGKEATVYLVLYENRLLALKVYKNHLTRSFKNTQDYVAGKYLRRFSERKAIRKKNRFGKDLQHKLWVKREFYLLKKIYEKGVNIPEPIEMTNNAILMEYIGDYNNPAPLLKDVKLTYDEKSQIYKKIIDFINIMYEAGVVHGDLSEYNILFWDNEPYFIDFPQSLDIRNNPNSDWILDRDRANIEKWYHK